jgi:hypothetical protein
LGQPRLTCQIYNSSHETMITPYKANRNKLWNSIFNQLNVERWNLKENYFKKGQKKLYKLKCQTHNPGNETNITP